MKQQFELLEQYIEGDISSEDKKTIEGLIASDSEWQKEFKLRTAVNKAIGEKEIMQLRYKLGMIYDAEIKSKTGTIRHLFEKKWHLAAASITILVLIGSFLVKTMNTSEPEKLFDKYYTTENAVFTTRSNDNAENMDLKAGLQFFQKRNYKQAIPLLQSQTGNLVAEYYLGISYIETEQFSQAEKAFDIIIERESNLFTEQAQWYKALCMLKLHEVTDARQLLTNIKNSTSIYNNVAEEILKKLD